MKTVYYLVLTAFGLILSIPVTIIMIAIQQASFNLVKIKKHMQFVSAVLAKLRAEK